MVTFIVRKASKSRRRKSAKRNAAKATPKKKRVAKLKSARAGARKVARKKAMKPPTTSVETVITDVAEEPVPGVITITEFEETEVREEGERPVRPEETPPESEER